MSDNSVDPSGSTEAFRAFTENAAAHEPTNPSRVPLFIGAAIVLAVLITVIVWAVG